MNENPIPGIAPTPNPKLTPAPQPTPMETPKVAPAAPQPAPTFTPNSTPAPGQVKAPSAPATAPTEPMPQATQKNKTGLIIGIIVGALIICGCALTIFFLFNPFKKDPNTIVYNAFANLVANEKNIHENTTFDGSISIGAMGTSLYDLTINGKSNKTAVEFNLGFSSSMLFDDVNIEANAIANKENVFLKINGIGDFASNYGLEIDPSAIENKWLSISYNELAKYLDTSNIELDTDMPDEIENINTADVEAFQCVQKELETLKDSKQSDKLLELYNAHAFIDAKDYDGDEIKAKKDALYAITIDEAKFVDWVNATVIESDLFNGVFDCLNTSSHDMDPIEMSDLEDFEFPTLYIEINAKEEITRFYIPLEVEDNMKLTIDFVINYPDTLEILEPTDVKTIEDLMKDLLSNPTQNADDRFLIQ